MTKGQYSPILVICLSSLLHTHSGFAIYDTFCQISRQVSTSLDKSPSEGWTDPIIVRVSRCPEAHTSPLPRSRVPSRRTCRNADAAAAAPKEEAATAMKAVDDPGRKEVPEDLLRGTLAMDRGLCPNRRCLCVLGRQC
mmetsp:Transcript_80545/g.134601  ORF Transcript_80545/g.134601 Transcript_80545/m.134601 type:complete len:138 (-) Transcript_80545:1359-1772(-)